MPKSKMTFEDWKEAMSKPAVRRIIDRPTPTGSGCFVDGKEVPLESIYTKADLDHMEKWGTE